jgi:molybdopterin/thiamine biosynthesis adenylyltransferase/rhodanese-related sulfurtransferase
MPQLPPLVEPDAWLSPKEITRYSRQLIIPELRSVGQKRLKNARVLCLGAGGLSGPVLTYLAASGVGTLGIAEREDGAAQRRGEVLREANPQVRLAAHGERLDANSSRKLFALYDLVIDGSDDPAGCHLVDYACAAVGKPFVWGAARGREGRASVFWAGHGPRLRDAGPEAGVGEPAAGAGGGYLVLWASIGAVMATEAIKLITGIGEPLLGRMLVHDVLGGRFRTVRIEAEPDTGPPPTEVTPQELKAMLERGDPIDLIDIREPAEWEISTIPGGRRVPMAQWLDGSALATLSPDRRPVFYCRRGDRTLEVLAALRRAGFPDAAQLQGGVNGWANHIDQSLPVY